VKQRSKNPAPEKSSTTVVSPIHSPSGSGSDSDDTSQTIIVPHNGTLHIPLEPVGQVEQFSVDTDADSSVAESNTNDNMSGTESSTSSLESVVEDSSSDDHSDQSEPPPLIRSTRNRQRPVWQRSGDYVLP
jgi:hypothetical protein